MGHHQVYLLLLLLFVRGLALALDHHVNSVRLLLLPLFVRVLQLLLPVWLLHLLPEWLLQKLRLQLLHLQHVLLLPD